MYARESFVVIIVVVDVVVAVFVLSK